MKLGIDVSSYQDPNQSLLEGKSFCIIKATEGIGYTNPNRGAWFDVATAAGVTVGTYHFMQSGNNPVEQAQYYLANLPGDVTWHALDVECSADGLTWAQRVQFILDWCAYVGDATHKSVLVYMNRYWTNEVWAAATPQQRVELSRWLLWLADYTGTPGVYSGPCNFDWTVFIHQYTSTPIDTNAILAEQKEDDVSFNEMIKSPDELGGVEAPAGYRLAFIDYRVGRMEEMLDKIADVTYRSGIDRPYSGRDGNPLPNTDLTNVGRWDAQHWFDLIDRLDKILVRLDKQTVIDAEASTVPDESSNQ